MLLIIAQLLLINIRAHVEFMFTVCLCNQSANEISVNWIFYYIFFLTVKYCQLSISIFFPILHSIDVQLIGRNQYEALLLFTQFTTLFRLSSNDDCVHCMLLVCHYRLCHKQTKKSSINHRREEGIIRWWLRGW